MANKPLKTIKFPGLSDTYTVPQIDDTLSVLGAAADAKKTGDEISGLKSDLTKLENSLVSPNLYDATQQTPDTISPHYYFNGAPYSTTQFDNQWNATALIEVEPNTTYTVGLIPAISNYTVPWRASAQGLFQYDGDGVYISGTNATTNTFTTNASCKYIRFNYYIGTGWGLSEINARCVLVKGSSLPESYIPYHNLIDDVAELKEKVETDKPYWFRISSDKLEIGSNYSASENLVITMDKHGGNNLFDFDKVYAVPISTPYSEYDDATKRTLLSNGSDMFSPYVVKAVNNADGTDPAGNATHFTGGNHQYNNTGEGSTATARTATIKFFADDREVTASNTGYACKVTAKWINYVQGNNTEKIDGTGREIIKVYHAATFENGKISVSTEIEPLEDVIMTTFYGFQCFCDANSYPNQRYIGGSNRLVYTGNSNSGDKYCYETDLSNSTDMAKISINPNIDLGRLNHGGTTSAFCTVVKSYYNVIRSDTTMQEGELYVLRGAYEFKSIQQVI